MRQSIGYSLAGASALESRTTRRCWRLLGEVIASMALLALFALQMACSPGSKAPGGPKDCLGKKDELLVQEGDAETFAPTDGAVFGPAIELSKLSPLLQAVDSGDDEAVADAVDGLQRDEDEDDAAQAPPTAAPRAVTPPGGDESVGEVSQAVEGGSPAYRDVVRVTVEFSNGHTQYGSGFVVDDQDEDGGSHFAMTAGHLLRPQAHAPAGTPNRPSRITITEQLTGTSAEVTISHVNPNYRDNGGATINDYAILWFANNLPSNIFRRLRIRMNYLPNLLANGCPNDPASVMGMGANAASAVLGTQRTLSIQAYEGWGSAHRLYLMPPATELGDSGGPVIVARVRCPTDDTRVDERGGNPYANIREVVGIVASRDVVTATGVVTRSYAHNFNEADIRSMMTTIGNALNPVAALPPAAPPSQVQNAFPTQAPNSNTTVFPTALPTPNQAHHMVEEANDLMNNLNEFHGNIVHTRECG